jgi:hypothetical protein
MTKKDYKLIALALKQARYENDVTQDYNNAINKAVSYIADTLAADNDRFDRDRFVEATY